MNSPFPSFQASFPEGFLDRLVAEYDDKTVRAIILHGSYARGEAIPPYSDVDIVRIIYEVPDTSEDKRFLAREGYLLSLSTRPLSVYRHRLTQPEKAIFTVAGIQEAQILLEKDEAFRQLRQEVLNWQWSPLQQAANAYASRLLVEQTEIILKILRALSRFDTVALADMITFDLLPAVTDAVAVQQGIMIKSGNTYLHQVQETIGTKTAWTHASRSLMGAMSEQVLSLEERGRLALSLYQETVRFLDAALLPDHREPIALVMQMINKTRA